MNSGQKTFLIIFGKSILSKYPIEMFKIQPVISLILYFLLFVSTVKIGDIVKRFFFVVSFLVICYIRQVICYIAAYRPHNFSLASMFLLPFFY